MVSLVPHAVADINPIRQVKEKGIVGDIYSRLPANSVYINDNPNIMNAVHEGTHGLNSVVRNGSSKFNGVYLLDGKTVRLKEPAITISDVIRNIPNSLRGQPFKFNLTDWHTKAWENQPLYIIDEWFAYSHGTMYLVEIGELNKWEIGPQSTADLTFFSFALLQSLPEGYEDREKLTNLVQWNVERMFSVIKASRISSERWTVFNRSNDCKSLRQFVLRTYGEDWAKKYEILP